MTISFFGIFYVEILCGDFSVSILTIVGGVGFFIRDFPMLYRRFQVFLGGILGFLGRVLMANFQ